MELEEVVEQFAEEGRDDHIGLWELVRTVREDLGISNAETVGTLTLDLIRVLLTERGMEAGFPTPDGRGFCPWRLTINESIRRIEQEWATLGRDPNIGEVVWFNNPTEREDD